MKLAIRNAFVFATTAFVLAVLADFAAFDIYQGGTSNELRNEILMTHGVFLLALLGLAMIGSLLAFAIQRRRPPSVKGAAILGVLYSVASFFIAVMAFQIGGLIASAAWMLLGAFAFSMIGTLRRGGHNG